MAAKTVRIILIGGTSHVGKTTLSVNLAARLGWTALSTDSLARHPGRPWRPDLEPPPPHVAEHYGTLAPEALIASVLAHYEGMWPIVRQRIDGALDELSGGLALEGSALLPQFVAGLADPRIAAVCLTAAPALITERIRRASDFDHRDADARALIEAFVERSLRYDRLTIAAAARFSLPRVTVSAADTPDTVAKRVLALVGLEG